ncbi:hypothetical protein D3C80_1530830 [compost metagenome]
MGRMAANIDVVPRRSWTPGAVSTWAAPSSLAFSPLKTVTVSSGLSAKDQGPTVSTGESAIGPMTATR